MFFEWQVFFVERYVNLHIALDTMDLKDWAAVCSIIWILLQLIQRRRINEANVDKYLERHFSDKTKNVEEQRQTYLAHFSAIASTWMISRLARFCLSSVLRVLWFVWRLAKFEFRRRPSAWHAMLLFDGGRSGPAHREFLDVAEKLLDTATSYRKQAALKRREAINALIFAGRVAALDKDSESTIEAFRRVIEIRDTDYDARKFIGQQYREVGNLSAALREFKALNGLTAAKRDKALAAEAFRLQAEVFTEDGDTAAACVALDKSMQIETARRDIKGIAISHDLLGDAYKRAGEMQDAAAAYRASLQNYQTIDDRDNVQRVHSKLWRLQPEETFLSHLVASFATFLMERVAKSLRAPAPMP